MLQVIKENNSFPIGAEFLWDEEREIFTCVHRDEETSDNMSYVSEQYWGFSPSFYVNNKKLFNQVKLEEQNEKNKNTEAEANTPAESESEDTYSKVVSSDGCIYSRHAKAENVQREEVEEESEERESERNSLQQEGPIRAKNLFEKSRSKDKRAARYAAVEQQLNNWEMSFDKIVTAFAKSFNDIKDNMAQLKQELK